MKTVLFLSIFLGSLGFAKPLQKGPAKPKLVLVLVIDQFRADYLTRFESRFLPVESAGKVGGFKFLMSKGSYFPLAEYDIAHAMTCPGHAMIMSGSYPVDTGIPLNEWYDRTAKKDQYCVEDEKYGQSPIHLKTSTVGDELKNAGHKSKVVGIALKDRSAIMLSGHGADHVFWFDFKNFQWTTSAYYSTQKALPNWVSDSNSLIKSQVGKEYVWKASGAGSGLSEVTPETDFIRRATIGSPESTAFPYGIDITIDLAIKAIKKLNLGKSSSPDILNLSFSSHDALGHRLGANSRELEEMAVYHDLAFSRLFNELKNQKLLDQTLIVLTADHGVAPSIEFAKKQKLDSAEINYLELFKKLNQGLDQKWGLPKNKKWVASYKTTHIYFDPETLAEKKLSSSDVEAEAKKILMGTPGILDIFTASDFRSSRFPNYYLGSGLSRQYLLDLGGDLVLIPRPFHFPAGDSKATHVTGYSYDKFVPLVFWGRGIQSGTHPSIVKVVDIAPTLSFILGILPPATSSGRILDIF